MTEIRNNPAVDHRTFETNAQHVGAQRDTAPRKNGPTAKTTGDTPDIHDQVELGQEAGVHTGSTQNLSGASKRHEAARAALAQGNVTPGSIAPGEGDTAGEPQAQQAGAQAMGGGAQPIAGGPQPLGGGAPPPGGVGGPQPTMGLGGNPGFTAGPLGGGVNPGQVGGSVDPTQGQGQGGPGQLTTAAGQAQYAQADALQAQTILWQMAADRQRALTDQWKIYQDLQTTQFQKMQEVMIYRQQVMDKISQKWSEVLRGA